MFSLVCENTSQCEFLVYVNKLKDAYVYVRDLNLKHTCLVVDNNLKMSINTLVCENPTNINMTFLVCILYTLKYILLFFKSII